MLNQAPVAAVLLEYKLEGFDAEALACHVKQQFPDLPIILISACSEIPERILWLVDDYVMRSELAGRPSTDSPANYTLGQDGRGLVLGGVTAPSWYCLSAMSLSAPLTQAQNGDH